MFNYLKADLYRIFRKQTNYLFYGILAALFIVLVIAASGTIWNLFGELDAELSPVYFELGILALNVGSYMVIGAQSYYTVYLEDFSINNLPNIFTTGLRKHEYLLSKILAQAIYLIVVFAFLILLYIGGYLFFQINVANPGFASTDLLAFLESIVIVYFSILAFSMITHMVGIFLQRSDFSLVLFFILVNGLIVQMFNLLTNINGFEFLETVNEYALSTISGNAITEITSLMQQGSLIGSLFVETILISLAYLIGSFIITWIILKQVEIKE